MTFKVSDNQYGRSYLSDSLDFLKCYYAHLFVPWTDRTGSRPNVSRVGLCLYRGIHN